MKRRWVRAAAVLFWLVMMGWLLRYEAFPDRFTHAMAGYRGALAGDVLMEDSWMRILFNNAPIGYSHTSLDVNETDAVRHTIVNNRTDLRLSVMGDQQRISMDTSVQLDVMYNLQRFSFEMESGGYPVVIKGSRVQGNQFQVAIRTGASLRRERLEIPDDVVLYSPVLEMAMRRLKPGQHMVVRTLDPATLGTAPVTIRALRREPLVRNGVTNEATVLSSEYHGMTFLTWMGRQGEVLREDTPFGWTLESCTADEAFEALRSAAPAGDVLRDMAVKCEGQIRNPTGCRALKLRLSGVEFRREELASDRQIVERQDGAETDLRVLAAQRPECPADAPPAGPEFAAALAASAFVQSDHPDVVARARQIVGSRTNLYERALAIHDWVHANVRKEPTVSLPSALDVLRRLAGDCNEHTYLFVALARAAGVPAKIEVGIVYHAEAFYYHAWPAAYVGEWLEMDPTFGQAAVDATHIALAEGELASQLEIMKVVGRLKIEVLEERGGEGQKREP